MHILTNQGENVKFTREQKCDSERIKLIIYQYMPLIPEIGTPLIGQEESFTIAVGAVNSNAIKAKGGNNATLMVYGSVVTDGALTYKYQVSPDNANWFDLVDAAAAAIIPPLQGKAKALNEAAAWYRIVASGNVTAVPKVWFVTAEL